MRSEKHPLILIEAEQFADYGGWVLDSQFMDVMGSPYLLAHGLGVPVRDAATPVNIPEGGGWRLWVRTKDWVAPWGAPGAPGRFQVRVNGQAVPVVFGTEGAEWHWQDGGMVMLPPGVSTLALHDLSGFEGRCDAILLCRDTDCRPPDDPAELAALRSAMLDEDETTDPSVTFDLVVAGGGIAGICAALAAARLGLSVALVQDRPVVGGNNSSEVRVWLGGGVGFEPYPQLGNLVKELEPEQRANAGPAAIYEDDKRLMLLAREPNLRLFLNHRVVQVDVKGSVIGALIAQDVRSGRRRRIVGQCFADCTGDGAVGFLAGADYALTPHHHMGPSNLWNVRDSGRPAAFSACPWALNLADKPFPGRGPHAAQWSVPGLDSLGQWFWECGFDWDPIGDKELMRDWNFRAMYGAWDVLKNVDGLYPNHVLNWAAYVAGARESRRLLGDVVLSKDDMLSNRDYADACFPASWGLDLHVPHPAYRQGFEGCEFISWAERIDHPVPYWVPYRCLYSRNLENLFMAGRDISVTHEALGSVRVMRSGGMMGEVVGMAARLAVTHACTPRMVYEKHFDRLKTLLRQGIPAAPVGGHSPPS